MNTAMAKRILGGIAWAWSVLLSHSAMGQYGYLPPAATPIASSAQQAFPPGMSSKDYLRLMAEANETRLASEASPRPVPQVPETKHGIQEVLALPSPIPASPLPGVPVAPQVAEPFSTPATPNPAPASAGPRFSATVEHIWLRRSGDEGTSWSSGGSLGGFGEDRSTAYRLGWYSNPMERYEFAFLGSMVWSRNEEHLGPVSGLFAPSMLQPAWFDSFQDSQRHEQFHKARLRSYELNKRWITDDLGNYFIGLHTIDYQETYRLQSFDADGAGALGLSTTNLLAGLQGGMELWRPISQRIAIGGQGLCGLYGNFADGDWQVDAENAGSFRRGDEKFQLAASIGLDAKVRYQFTSRSQAFAGYRWWYLAGMATVDDQTIGPLANDTPFALSTDAGFLLQGATCGLEILF